MTQWSLAVLLVSMVTLPDHEPIDPNPPEPRPDHGCVVIVTNLGPIVICR